MAFLQTANGKFLYIGGKLITGQECCCDDECPQCPPLGDMPKLCALTVTTPIGDYVLSFQGPDASLPSWQKEIRLGVCWYTYEVELSNPTCIGTCQEQCDPGRLVDFGCERPEMGCCCVDPGPDDPCEEDDVAPATYKIQYDGYVKYGFRDLISAGQAKVQFEYNCQTGAKYRKVQFSYIRYQNLKGRFVGTRKRTQTVTALSPNGGCTIGQKCLDETIDYNTNEAHLCDECPQFNNMGGEEYDIDHNWRYETWFDQSGETGGMQYGARLSVVYDEGVDNPLAAWTSVSDFFGNDSVVTEIGNDPGTGFDGRQACGQITESVTVEIDTDLPMQELSFNCPSEEWDSWQIIPAAPGDPPTVCATPNFTFEADAPYPPLGVSIEGEYDEGDTYITHAIEFLTGIPCDPANTNEAGPC